MKNCVAAAARNGPPQKVIRKNAGNRLSSQKKNQWKKFNAVNVPKRPACKKRTREKYKGTFSAMLEEASIATGVTMAVNKTISNPRPSMPTKYSPPMEGIHECRSTNCRSVEAESNCFHSNKTKASAARLKASARPRASLWPAERAHASATAPMSGVAVMMVSKEILFMKNGSPR